MNSTAPQWCYSTNEEQFHGQFDSEEEAHVEAQSELECDGIPGHECAYWVAKVKPGWEFLNARRLGEWTEEQAEEWLCDNIGWDDRLVELTPEEHEELGQKIIDYLREKNAFRAYGVGDVKEHRHTIPLDETSR